MNGIFKVVRFNLSQNKKYLVIFSILILICTSLIYTFPMIISELKYDELSVGFGGYISTTLQSVTYYYGGGTGKSGLSYSFFIRYIMCGIPFFLLIAVFTILFINLVMVNEVGNKNVCSWLSLPLSRTNIYFAKFIGVVFFNLLMTLSMVVPTLIFTGFSCDASKNFSFVLYKIFYFIMYELFFTIIIILLSTLMIDSQTMLNVILSLVVVYFLLCMAVEILVEMKVFTSSLAKNFVKYLSINNFNVDTLIFSENIKSTITIKDAHNNIIDLISDTHIKNTKATLLTYPLTELILFLLLFYLSLYKIRTKNFYI